MSVKVREQRGKLYLDIYHNGTRKWESLHITLSDDKKRNKELYRLDMAEIARNIRLLLRNLMWNITAANTIYAKNELELAKRREYQTAAIINCQQLIQELEFCCDTLPLRVDKLQPYLEAISFEIKLLKGWRKSGNKISVPFAEKPDL